MEYAQQSSLAAHPGSIPRAAATLDTLADRIECQLTGNIEDRLVLALRIGRALLQRHEQHKFHGSLHTGCVLLDGSGHIHFDEAAARSTEEARVEDVRAFGRILCELISGEVKRGGGFAPDIDLLLKAGYAERLVEVVRICLQMETPGKADLRKAVAQLEKALQGMRKQPARVDEKALLYWFGAVIFSTAMIMLWVFD